MLSRENRVILGSFCLALVVLAAIIVAEQWLGITDSNYPVLAFLIFAGLTVGLPQLYLARTDTTVSPRSRVRFAVIVTMVFAAGFSGTTDGLQAKLIGAIGGGAFLGLVCYELYAGYRDSATDSPMADLGR